MRFFACALWTLAASSAAIDIASSTDPLSSDVAAVASLGHSIDRRGGGGSSSRHTHSDHHGGKENTKHPHDAHHKNGDKDHNNSDKDNDKNDSNDDKNNKPSGHRGSTKDFSRKSINSFSLRAWGPWETTTKGDAIFVDLQFAPKSLAKRLKKMGKQVVCYISVGTVGMARDDLLLHVPVSVLKTTITELHYLMHNNILVTLPGYYDMFVRNTIHTVNGAVVNNNWGSLLYLNHETPLFRFPAMQRTSGLTKQTSATKSLLASTRASTERCVCIHRDRGHVTQLIIILYCPGDVADQLPTQCH
jgi:hypothetical protein